MTPTPAGAVARPAILVLLSVMLFGSGHLSSITLATLDASARGLTSISVGALTSLPFVGLLTGALLMPRLLRRTRHVRLIAIATSGCALTLMFLPYVDNIPLLAVLRFAYGFSAAGVWLCCDLWVAHVTETTGNRSKILGVYQMSILLGTAVGQALLVTIGDDISFGFVIAAAVMVGAVIPVSSTVLEEPPADGLARKLPLRMALRFGPLPLVGSFIAGLCFSNFPFIMLHFSSSGAAPFQVASLGVIIVFAGAVGQVVVGFLSDRHGNRRQVLLIVAVLSLLALLGMWFSGTGAWARTLVIAAIYGACIVTIYPLNVALAGDYVSREFFGPMAAKCFLAINIGNLLGPMLGGMALQVLPEFGTITFIALALLALLAAALSPRMLARHQPLETGDFAPLMPMGVNPELSDPRVQQPQEAAAGHDPTNRAAPPQ